VSVQKLAALTAEDGALRRGQRAALESLGVWQKLFDAVAQDGSAMDVAPGGRRRS
jgi:hypothetical protein